MRVLLRSSLLLPMLAWITACGNSAGKPSSLREALAEFLEPGGVPVEVKQVALHPLWSEATFIDDPGRMERAIKFVLGQERDASVERLKWEIVGHCSLTRSDNLEIELCLMQAGTRWVFKVGNDYYAGRQSIKEWFDALRASPK